MLLVYLLLFMSIFCDSLTHFLFYYFFYIDYSSSSPIDRQLTHDMVVVSHWEAGTRSSSPKSSTSWKSRMSHNNNNKTGKNKKYKHHRVKLGCYEQFLLQINLYVQVGIQITALEIQHVTRSRDGTLIPFYTHLRTRSKTSLFLYMMLKSFVVVVAGQWMVRENRYGGLVLFR